MRTSGPWGNPLDHPGVARALKRYVQVVRGRLPPLHQVAASTPAPFSHSQPTEELWRTHQRTLEGEPQGESLAEGTLLDLKAELARRIMSSCAFCERRCGVDRLGGERGFCGAGDKFTLYSAFPHLGEEPELVPSGTLFTGGCSIRCLHCQNWDISQWASRGVEMGPREMARQMEKLERRGCINLNLVGGDPTPYLWHWLEAFKQARVSIPMVWNSNSYYSPESARLLAGFADLYLLDFKYGNNECAEELSQAPGYWEACTRNHLEAAKHGELIVRVLVLPGHNHCCTRPILEWIARNLGPGTRVNLMFQYRPEWRAPQHPTLKRRLTAQEIAEAREMAREAGLINLVR